MSLIKWLTFRRDPEPDISAMGPLYREVLSAMTDVQAYARTHGGRIELVEVNQVGDVKVKFHGACLGCPMSALTLREGIEERIRQEVPAVSKIIVLS